jgi:hypothetical protein
VALCLMDSDIGFIDVDLQFHLLQVLGDREQHRRPQRRGAVWLTDGATSTTPLIGERKFLDKLVH